MNLLSKKSTIQLERKKSTSKFDDYWDDTKKFTGDEWKN